MGDMTAKCKHGDAAEYCTFCRQQLTMDRDMLERRIRQLLGSHSDSVGYYRNGLLAAIRALKR